MINLGGVGSGEFTPMTVMIDGPQQECGIILDEIRQIEKTLGKVDHKLDKIKSNYQKANLETNSKKKDKLFGKSSKSVDNVCRTCEKLSMKKLDNRIKEFSEAYPNATSVQTVKNEFTKTLNHFKLIMKKIQNISSTMKKAKTDRVKRQANVLFPDMNERDLENVIQAENPDLVMQQLLTAGDLEANEEVLARVEEQSLRNQGVQQLENGVLKLQEMWKEFEYLVDMQGYVVDDIAGHVAATGDYVEKAEVNMDEAKEYQQAASSNRCWWAIAIALVLSVVIVVLMWRFKVF